MYYSLLWLSLNEGKILNAIDEREDQYIDILIETQQACILSVYYLFTLCCTIQSVPENSWWM